jgi:hypothetical protein
MGGTFEDGAMRRTKNSVSPNVDVVEPRALLSAATPLLTQHALHGVVRDVKAIMSTLARTEDTVGASAQLTGLSSRIPSGTEELAPTWRRDLKLYRPHSTASVSTAEKRILRDLYRYDRGGGGGGNAPVTGSGSTTPPTTSANAGGTSSPVSAPSLDSVSIQNTTGLALRVTVHLEVPQVQKPWITEIIPAQGTTIVPFNFGTATDAFMTMDVSRADGGQSPPPLTNLSLDQPMDGYNGALFTISLFGSYFNITPG